MASKHIPYILRLADSDGWISDVKPRFTSELESEVDNLVDLKQQVSSLGPKTKPRSTVFCNHWNSLEFFRNGWQIVCYFFFIPRRVLRFLNLHRWHRKSRISQLTSQDLFLNIQPRSFEFHFNLWCVSLSWPSYRDFQSTYENKQHSEQMIVFKDSEQTIAFNAQYWLAWIDVWGGSSQWTWENQSS